MKKPYQTYVVPDYSQLPVTIDTCSCNRCQSRFKATVSLELSNPLVACSWCGHIQEYNGSFNHKK